MRMWLGVDPSEMCRKHLLGEHVEIHMLAGCLSKGTNQAILTTRKAMSARYAMRFLTLGTIYRRLKNDTQTA